jgi:hypothetical protein
MAGQALYKSQNLFSFIYFILKKNAYSFKCAHLPAFFGFSYIQAQKIKTFISGR